MSRKQNEYTLSAREIELLHDALLWLAQFMAERLADSAATLAVARTAGLATRAYDRDAGWQDPANLAQLQRTLIADAAFHGRLPNLLQALHALAPDAAPSIDAVEQLNRHTLTVPVLVNPADMEVNQFPQDQKPAAAAAPQPQAQPQVQPQEPEAVYSYARTRGDESDAQSPPAGDHFETLCLDTAVPERVYLHQAFTLAVAVRQQSSSPRMRDGLPVTASGGVDVFWPEGAAYVSLRLRISAPDCTIHGSKGDKFRLLPGRDSPDFLYHLTPKRTGPISILVTVYQEEERLGTAGVDTLAGETEVQTPALEMNRSISTEAPQPAGAVTMQVQSHVLLSLPVARALRGLHAVLIEYFRKSDEALVMASQAGLDPVYIRTSDILADLWWNVLEAAHAEQRIADLVDVAKSRVNRRAATLDTAYQAYAQVV